MSAPTAQVLTHTRLATFRACPRRHYLRYELGLRPETTGFALKVGSAFHRAIEAVAKGSDPEAAIAQGLDDPYDLALVAAMFDGHQRRWAGAGLEVLASEVPFDLPLVNPATGAPTPIWRLGGVIDAVVRLPDGRLALLEVKTTSRDFAPGADYWLRLHLDSQLSIYVIAARELDFQVETVLYDVTRRPALRPLKATPEAARKFTKAGALYANQRDRDETPEEFAARIAADIAAKPEHYFARIEIARLDQDLEECRRDLWIQQQAVRACQRGDAWYRNPGACFEPFACDYLAVCQHRDLHSQTPIGFVRSDCVHPEFAGDASLGG
ncbi:MAG: PD-(D/E)XK nuclease family protein [Planctomycetota bacterium]